MAAVANEKVSLSLPRWAVCVSPTSQCLARRRAVFFAALVLAIASPQLPFARGANLDEMSLTRWAKLREVERYQLKIAEKYYREKNYKVALAEYEKFLTLYERSEGAPFSQLKWSLCQVQLRKLNTAVKEGFQSVIDYWPDSPDAVKAAYFIGKSYKDMGDIKNAKLAYSDVLEKHPKHLIAVYAITDLIDISRIEEDVESRVELWRRLTFDAKRVKESKRLCVEASEQLATHYFQEAGLTEAVKALATSYTEQEIPNQIVTLARRPLEELTVKDETRAEGVKLADEAIAWIRGRIPAEPGDEQMKKRAQSHWYFMADLLVASRRHDEVPEFYARIMQKFGTDDDTLGRFAAWHKSRKQYDRAREQYAKYANKSEGQNQIGLSHRDQENYDAAVGAFRRNLSLDPENQVHWNYMVAHTYHYYARKYKEAIAIYEELLKSDLDATDRWLWQIATAYRDWGRHKQAIAYYRQCNNFPANYSEMAQCHRRLKEYGEAIILYNQIIGGDPKSAPSALLQIGHTHEQAGQKEKAIQAFQQVCKRYPKDRYASVAHAYLQDKYKISVTLGGATDE